MYVCVCNAVTDREIVERVRAGADTLEAVRFELGVATCCGQCAECAQAVIDDARRTLAGEDVVARGDASASGIRRPRVLLA